MQYANAARWNTSRDHRIRKIAARGEDKVDRPLVDPHVSVSVGLNRNERRCRIRALHASLDRRVIRMPPETAITNDPVGQHLVVRADQLEVVLVQQDRYIARRKLEENGRREMVRYRPHMCDIGTHTIDQLRDRPPGPWRVDELSGCSERAARQTCTSHLSVRWEEVLIRQWGISGGSHAKWKHSVTACLQDTPDAVSHSLRAAANLPESLDEQDTLRSPGEPRRLRLARRRHCPPRILSAQDTRARAREQPLAPNLRIGRRVQS